MVAAAVRGIAVLPNSIVSWLATCQIGVVACTACVLATLWDDSSPFGSFIAMLVFGCMGAAAFGVLAAVPMVVGLLNLLRNLSLRPASVGSSPPDGAGPVALSVSRVVTSASG